MTHLRRSAVVALAVTVAACGFDLTGPFEGFDGQGTRVSGRFEDAAASGGGEVAAMAAAAPGGVEGIRVYVRERSSAASTVRGDGTFLVVGLPSGAWTLLFEQDGQVIGEVRFQSVRQNQEIRIVVGLVAGEVVLLEEDRDLVSFDEDCPRGAGFWCQNQGGQNPNLSRQEFEEFAAEAAALLSSVESLNTPEEVAAAVCDPSDQLRRHLATLALNLASGAVSRDAALSGEAFATVGAAFDAAVQASQGGAGDAEAIKDAVERINEGESLAGCDTTDDDTTPSPAPSASPSTPPSGGQLTICHVPPGNPSRRHTITIGASAWPAHQAHGDTLGPCGG